MRLGNCEITVKRQYNGTDWPMEPPDWLRDRIEKAFPFLNPGQTFVRLVALDVPGAELRYGQYAPCNGGFVVDFRRGE